MVDNIWEGVYQSFDDVPISGGGFNGDEWINNSAKKILKLLDNANLSGTVSTVVAYRASLLPLLVSLMGTQKKNINILDFGGGLGFTYIPVVHSQAEKIQLEYHIVEVESVCEKGAQLFDGDDQICFHTSIPPKLEFDIIHLGSSLQYIREWQKLLKQLASYQPKYILLTDLMAGDIPTYATAQNYYGSKIASWFFNIDEVLTEMSSGGFDLSFKSTYLGGVQK